MYNAQFIMYNEKDVSCPEICLHKSGYISHQIRQYKSAGVAMPNDK